MAIEDYNATNVKTFVGHALAIGRRFVRENSLRLKKRRRKTIDIYVLLEPHGKIVEKEFVLTNNWDTFVLENQGFTARIILHYRFSGDKCVGGMNCDYLSQY